MLLFSEDLEIYIERGKRSNSRDLSLQFLLRVGRGSSHTFSYSHRGWLEFWLTCHNLWCALGVLSLTAKTWGKCPLERSQGPLQMLHCPVGFQGKEASKSGGPVWRLQEVVNWLAVRRQSVISYSSYKAVLAFTDKAKITSVCLCVLMCDLGTQVFNGRGPELQTNKEKTPSLVNSTYTEWILRNMTESRFKSHVWK